MEKIYQKISLNGEEYYLVPVRTRKEEQIASLVEADAPAKDKEESGGKAKIGVGKASKYREKFLKRELSREDFPKVATQR